MGKNGRRKQLEAIKRELFEQHGDTRNSEERDQARAMLEKLQRKLEDDAHREDGFWFIDGKVEDARRARVTPGMRVESYDLHSNRVGTVAIVQLPCDPEATVNTDPQQVVCSFGTDKVCVWNFRPAKLLARVQIASLHSSSVCGAAILDTATITNPGNGLLDGPWLWLAYASHDEPLLHAFNYQTSCLYPPECSLSRTPDMTSRFCTGHQQQITCMSFSHDSKLLATGSWDSLCILWRVPNRPNTSDPSQLVRLSPLAVVQKLPVDDCGVLCLSFTPDDAMLVTCGECKIKVWNLDEIESTISTSPSVTQRTNNLSNELLEYESAIPSSFSVEYSLRVAEFDESLSLLISNFDWAAPNVAIQDPLVMQESLGSQQTDPISLIPDDAISSCINRCLGLATDTVEKFMSQDGDHHNQPHKNAMPWLAGDDFFLEDDPLMSLYTQTQLRTSFMAMDKFSFQELLNPAANSPNTCTLKAPSAILSVNTAQSRMFQDVTHDGKFARHTAMITGCSVEKDIDAVVTVSYDRSIKLWRLSDGVVLETVREAHPAPITCCALTSASACSAAGFEVLLATGGSDNMVKVWRRDTFSVGPKTECIYTLSGHYDAIKTLAFDPQAIFLVSAGDDTNVFTWRVRPSSPDTPRMPEVDVIDRFAIKIKWIEPLANGARITHYVVRTTQLTALESAGTSIRTVPDVEVASKYTTATVEKLQPGVEYSIQLAAVNNIGTSVFCVATAPIETLAFVPSRIEKPVRYHDCGSRSIRLSWAPPCPNGAVLESYTLRCIPENGALVPVHELTVPVSCIKLQKETADADELSDHKPLTKNENEHEKKGNRRAKPQTKRDKKHKAPAMCTSKFRDGSNSDNNSTEVSYKIDGLWPGEIYQFVVAASNRCGIGDFSRVSDYVKMDSTAPDAPAKPMITSLGKRHADLEWTKPRCNGSEILQYTLYWTQQDILATADCLVDINTSGIEAVVLLAHSVVGTTFRLTGLLPGTVLRTWMSATNLIDNILQTSPLSQASDIVHTVCGVPDAPEAPPCLLSPTSHSLDLVWEAPRSNGLPIERYDVVVYQEEQQFGVNVKNIYRELSLSREEWQQCDATSLAFKLLRLRGGNFYSSEVRAVNALGPGSASLCSIPVATLPSVAPPALVMEPRVENVTPTSATISWGTPPNDGGAPLSAYQIQLSSCSTSSINDGEEAIEEISLFDTGTEWHCSMLRPRRVYRFRVAARNLAGTGEYSPWSESVATPSLVEFTVSTYFANRPEIEHVKARLLQRRYRAWKVAVAARSKMEAGLTVALAGWHIL